MRDAWHSLLLADEDQDAKKGRGPVAPATRSAQAERKALTHTLPDGTPAHSFRTLLEELSTIVRNICRAPAPLPRTRPPAPRHARQAQAAASM